jgi:hypothetical protein
MNSETAAGLIATLKQVVGDARCSPAGAPHAAIEPAAAVLAVPRWPSCVLVRSWSSGVCSRHASPQKLDGQERLLAPLGREPHSVIGSSCFGAQ